MGRLHRDSFHTLYLIHSTLLETALAHFRSRNIAALIAIAASVLYAYAMYRVVEVPAAQLRRRLSICQAFVPESGRLIQEPLILHLVTSETMLKRYSKSTLAQNTLWMVLGQAPAGYFGSLLR